MGRVERGKKCETQDEIGPAESNGCYYHFSDGETPRIGWRVDWETLYNGKEWTTE